MFGNCLYGKFSNKCKHAFKCIKSRIGLIRKKKQAMIVYLKKDVAELLANGHDTNAFGRIDALIVEINHASCYDMIERYCECISQQLPSLRKQRECPEEATEAMATLIYAAARFSDLPELCNLRRMFTDRYGSQLESTTSREFVDKVQKKKFSLERKIQLMQYIAEEFSVSWDSKKFHRKISSNQPPKCSEKNDREEVYGDVDRDREVSYKVKWESARKSVVHREQVQPASPNNGTMVVFVRPLVSLLVPIVTRPTESVVTILDHGNAIPRDTNLRQLVRSDLIREDNFLFYFLVGFLRCFC